MSKNHFLNLKLGAVKDFSNLSDNSCFLKILFLRGKTTQANRGGNQDYLKI